MAEITAATTPLAPTLAERYVEARRTEDALATELKQASDAVEAIEQLLAESYQRSQEGADEQGWGEYGASDKSVRIASGATVRLEFSPKAMVKDPALHRAWAITDSARRSIQVRRMDGQPWTWNNAKAWTLGGSIAGWPIGAADIGNRRIVLFCEGGPDFLAAYAFAWLAGRADSVAVVCVPGASASIHPEALPFFAGKFVRIFEHADAAGSAAGQRWAAQLTQAGATVDGFTFDPPHKDLADLFAATDAESLNCPSDIFEGLTTEDSSCR